jgi:hypothetical protein
MKITLRATNQLCEHVECALEMANSTIGETPSHNTVMPCSRTSGLGFSTFEEPATLDELSAEPYGSIIGLDNNAGLLDS